MAVRTGTKRRPRRSQSVVPVLLLLVVIVFLTIALFRQPHSTSATEAPRTVYVGEYESVQIPVAAEPVPAGTKVKNITLKYVSFPKTQLPRGAVTDIVPFLEAVSIAPLPAHVPLVQENFSHAAAASNPVIDRIPAGMRAITVNVDATSSVEGWAGSGAVVDVLLIEKDRSLVVAERVKILSAERKVAPVDGAPSEKVPRTVTLLVSQEQALAINTAIPRGKIAFALRNNRDEDAWSDTVYTAARLDGGAEGPERPAEVTGYVSISGDDNKQQYVLVDGKWVPSNVKPNGFLVAENAKSQE